MKHLLSFTFIIGLLITKGQSNLQVNCSKPYEIKQTEIFSECIDYKKEVFDYREALLIAKKGIKKFPYDYNLRLKKALILENLGNTSAAEKELIGLIRLHPNRQELHNYLGRIFYDKDRSKALLALLTSISINPNSDLGKENLIFVKRLLEGRPIKTTNSDVKNKISSFKIDDFEIINEMLENMPKHKKNDDDDLDGRLNTFFELLNSYNNRKEGFFWKYYTPHYINIYKKKSVKKFTRHITNNE